MDHRDKEIIYIYQNCKCNFLIKMPIYIKIISRIMNN